jgi:hypothetical protein
MPAEKDVSLGPQSPILTRVHLGVSWLSPRQLGSPGTSRTSCNQEAKLHLAEGSLSFLGTEDGKGHRGESNLETMRGLGRGQRRKQMW